MSGFGDDSPFPGLGFRQTASSSERRAVGSLNAMSYGHVMSSIGSREERRRLPQKKLTSQTDSTNRHQQNKPYEDISVNQNFEIKLTSLPSRNLLRQRNVPIFPDLSSPNSRSDILLNRTYQIRENQNPRHPRRPQATGDDGFFSYISPSVAEKPVQKPRFTTQKTSSERIRPAPKKISKELEISDMDDLDLEDAGQMVMTRPINSVYSMKDPISPELATELKNLLFGNANRDFPTGWKSQAFEFNDKPDLKFGLVQHKGGPCGILAAVQAFILKFLIFPFDGDSAPIDCNFEGRALSPANSARNDALTSAVCHILTQCAKSEKRSRSESNTVIVAIPGLRANFSGTAGRYKSDGITETLCIYKFDEAEDGDFPNLHNFIEYHNPFLSGEGNSSVIAILYSAILSRGIDNIKDIDMDSAEVPLMGAHGYCSQEMVNLFLTGKATSNTFDGEKNLDTIVLKGITDNATVGFLTLFEHYGSCVVGDYFKSPTFPIWIICSESHFTVVFSLMRGAEKTSTAERHVVELIYYDGLGRQDEPIYIEVDCSDQVDQNTWRKSAASNSPIEHCLRTKWNDAKLNWKGSDPIL